MRAGAIDPNRITLPAASSQMTPAERTHQEFQKR